MAASSTISPKAEVSRAGRKSRQDSSGVSTPTASTISATPRPRTRFSGARAGQPISVTRLVMGSDTLAQPAAMKNIASHP